MPYRTRSAARLRPQGRVLPRRSATRRACACCSCCARASRRVGALQAALDLDSGGTSQHLAALRKQGLVESRREGTSVYYRVKDPRILELLELAKTILAAGLEDNRALLDDLAVEDFGPR